MNQQADTRFMPAFEKALWLILGVFVGLNLFFPWHWSLLMDEEMYNHTLNRYPSLWVGMKDLFWGYLGEGRLYPVKFTINLLEWRYLPASPRLFHALRLVLMMATLLLAWLAMRRRRGEVFFRLSSQSLVCFLAASVLAKPLLEMAQFLSIGESWAAFFLSVGIFFLATERSFAARFFFLVAVGCKEPMAGVFACAFVYQLALWSSFPRAKNVLLLTIDAVLFLALAAIFRMVMKNGPYLADYQLVSLGGLQSWIYSILRLGFFLSPLLLVGALWLVSRAGEARGLWRNPHERAWHLFIGLFFLGYLFVVTPKGSSGYLQIPSAMAAPILIFPFGWRGLELVGQHRGWAAGVLIFWVGMSAYSIQRWADLAQGISEPSVLFRELVYSSQPRMLLVHGAELTGMLQEEAIRGGWSKVQIHEATSDFSASLDQFKGDVILLDPIRYFDSLPATSIDDIESRVGGWVHVSTRSNAFRAYYGAKK